MVTPYFGFFVGVDSRVLSLKQLQFMSPGKQSVRTDFKSDHVLSGTKDRLHQINTNL